ARLPNLTAQYGSLIVAGPRSRELLARVTRADLSNEAFPWLAARSIALGRATAVAARGNYVGELGWELHLPNDDLTAVHELLTSAGAELGLAPFGLYAMESLRLE